jgi:allantoinase
MKEDPGLFDYWPYENRPKIEWPNGARVAFWVAPNIEFYELNPAVNPHRKAWTLAAMARATTVTA